MAIHNNRSIYRTMYRVGTNVLSTQNYTDTETADQLIMMYMYTEQCQWQVHDFKLVSSVNENQ